MKNLEPYIEEVQAIDWYAHHSDSDAVYRATERHKGILAKKLEQELNELETFEVLSKAMKATGSIRVGNVYYEKDAAGNLMFKLIPTKG